MEYRQFDPTPRLAPFLECLWTLTGQASELGGDVQPVLPDGRPELVIHFGDGFERLSFDGTAMPQALVLFAGQLDAQLTLRPTGRISVLGIRFRPFGAAALFPSEQQHLVGHTVALGSIDPKLESALSRIRSLTDAAAVARPLVEAVLLEALVPSRIDARIRYAANTIMRARGQVSINALAAATSVTRRHLERQFLRAVGLTPKRLARIARFQHALELLQQPGAGTRGVHTAAECGYADQSHFIRDFRDLAGCSPSEHLLSQAELTGFFVRGATVHPFTSGGAVEPACQ